MFLVAALATPQAWARSRTYCVSGYTGVASTVEGVNSACGRPSTEAQHWPHGWHGHNFVRRGNECFVCYDEVDNSCESDFLYNTPGFQAASAYDCTRLGFQDTADELIAHLVDGAVHKAPPPPETRLTASIEDITPGPYTAGDTIAVVAAVRDEAGDARQVGGRFRLVDDAGAVTELQGELLSDGTVRAEFTLPASADVRIEFLPDPRALAKRERLTHEVSEPAALKVEVCGLLARVVDPSDGASLISGQAATLRAVLLSRDDLTPVEQDASTQLAFTVKVQGKSPTSVPAGDDLSATWTPPPSTAPRRATIQASGESGGQVVCPARGDGGGVEVGFSDLGLSFDTEEMPETCYVGRPCTGTIRLILPAPGPARHQVDRLLADSETRVAILDGAVEHQVLPVRADNRYDIRFTYNNPRRAEVGLEIRRPAGVVAMAPHPIQVRLPLVLRLAPELDFGTVKAGAPVQEACGEGEQAMKLDFSDSQAAEEHRWALSLVGVEGCESRPVIAYLNDRGVFDTRPISPENIVDALDPTARWINLCLDVPRCAGEISPDGAGLQVAPLTPEFANQVTTVGLRWEVEGRGWVECYLGRVAPFGAGLLLAALLLGWRAPHRFSSEATIQVAGSLRGLKRSPAVLLCECPGSSARLFRSARLGLHADGTVNGNLRHAPVQLRATAEGLALVASGPLDVQNRRTRKWEPVSDIVEGHFPTPGAIYRAGETLFKVDPG